MAEIKRKIGLSATSTITATASLDFEALAAVAWVIANREEDIDFEDILRFKNVFYCHRRRRRRFGS